MMRSRRTAVLGAAMLALCLAATAQAQVTLQSLLGGGTMTVGDKVFTFDTYAPVSGTNSSAPDAGHVLVIPITNGDEEGIRFDFGSLLYAGPGLADGVSVTIDYDVQSNLGNLISDMTLTTTGTSTSSSSWFVTETVTDATAPNYAINYDVSSVAGDNSDHQVFGSPIALANVHKVINLNATSGKAAITSVDQTFSQTPVPLPAAVWASFSMLGLLGIARMRKAWLA